MVLLNLAIADGVQAQPFNVTTLLGIAAVETTNPGEIIEQLKTQLETILTPEQREKFQFAIINSKVSARKALKTLSLTPKQKSESVASFKSLPKKDIFTSMTPEKRKQLMFLNKGQRHSHFVCDGSLKAQSH
ncbi:hypothetical protein [Chlorogloea sp. CCALA 695]|uniref:hypothetical protein n=1 Tax=Chlorogloea sp. CCALA 695 TaxID=2107693 RepID=UPI000D06FFE9|nr:hypothetical protein [Chlorogloea sp. CCALA 695]PSB30225.1 hypothetical protein C7B70_16760 [Chlorogloea sp. CCALA 695]